MSKKIKVMIGIIILLAILCIANISSADDTFTPSQFYPYTANNGYTYYCKQKYGKLRFGQLPEKTETDKWYWNSWKTKYTMSKVVGTKVTKETEEDILNYINKDVISKATGILAALASGEDYKYAYFIESGLGSDYNGSGEDKFENLSEIIKENGFVFDYEKTGRGSSYSEEDIGNLVTFYYKGKSIATTPTYTTTKGFEANNEDMIRVAYILTSNYEKIDTAGTDYKPTVSDKATIEDKQSALWDDSSDKHKDESGNVCGNFYNEGPDPTETDNELYNEAKDYETFYNSVKKGYDAYFNDVSNLKVIVSRSEGLYTVGPLTITYPDDTRFSFISKMYITNQDGTVVKTLNDDNIIQNDETRIYPKNEEQFFIKFNASDLDYPTSIKVFVEFKYLDEVYAAYVKWTGEGKEYELNGSLSVEVIKNTEEKEWTALETNANIWYAEVSSYTPQPPVEVNELVTEDFNQVNTIPDQKNDTYYVGGHEITLIRQETIKNWKDEKHTLERTWKTVSINNGFNIDLTTQISGRVWVESTKNKQSTADGLYNPKKSGELEEDETNDIPMEGIKVVLHGKNQGIIDEKETNSNGQYTFTGLSALDQYFVQFWYNGQYYEPTYYTQPSNEGDNWKNTSNGVDVLSGSHEITNQRKGINERFFEIGSSTKNYYSPSNDGYNEVYTRDELKEAGVIDEFGELKNELFDESGEFKKEIYRNEKILKMIHFVQDCIISSWTFNASSNDLDYYPSSNIIVLNYQYDIFNNLQEITVKSSSGDINTYTGVDGIINAATEDKSQYINQGYSTRQEVDIELYQDIYSTTIEINGKKQTDYYSERDIKIQTNGVNITVDPSDGYYNTKYSREIYPSDYKFKVTDYGDYNKYGKTVDDELKVYVTYKITVVNASQTIRTKVMEIVEYYDSDYEYVENGSCIVINDEEVGDGSCIVVNGKEDKKESRLVVYGEKIDQKVNAKTTSRYGKDTQTEIEGYNALYIQGIAGGGKNEPDSLYLDSGSKAEIYLTFMVKKDTIDGLNWIRLDENVETAKAIGVGKECIAEINGYSTLYKEGTEIPNVGEAKKDTVAGIVDRDSHPGNLNSSDVPKDGNINEEALEDDTDKAPNIRLVLNRTNDGRITSGYVWEDERTQTIENQATATGNGIREDGEKLINGVTVQLVEVMDNGTEYVWREFGSSTTGTGSIGKGTGTGTVEEETPIINYKNIVTNYKFTGDTTGTYAFKSFIPGNYIVRFIYGQDERTVLTTNSEVTEVLGKTGLNDTSYNGQDYKSTIYQANLGTYNGKNVTKQYDYDIEKGDTALVSDAKDLYNVRESVNNYSTGEVRNAFAEELVSYINLPTYNGKSYDKNTMSNLLNNFIQNTTMIAETGIIDMGVEYNITESTGNTENNKKTYHLANLDLGLEERPKAQIEINKDIKNFKITLANGNALFDATQTVDNLLWISNNIYSSYENYLMAPGKFGSIDNIRLQRTFGLVQATVDQELMHGATVRIEYEITATNIGEVDYREEQFYYTGKVKDKNTLVTTTPIRIVDYVPNNLQYYEVDNNEYWTVVKTEYLMRNGLVNVNLESNLEKFNTILLTTYTNTALVPVIYSEKVDSSKSSSVSVPLILTQLITAENTTDDLAYINVVELVASSNTTGRKMAYSIVGNQDPTNIGAEQFELDSDRSTVIILPPFGTTLTYVLIAIITIAGAAIIITGVIFIKKKVLIK